LRTFLEKLKYFKNQIHQKKILVSLTVTSFSEKMLESNINSDWVKSRKLFELIIAQQCIVILLPTTLISFTKLRLKQ
jgi:hypothetical protein